MIKRCSQYWHTYKNSSRFEITIVRYYVDIFKPRSGKTLLNAMRTPISGKILYAHPLRPFYPTRGSFFMNKLLVHRKFFPLLASVPTLFCYSVRLA